MVTDTSGEKQYALRPGLLVYWPSWLKALPVKICPPSGHLSHIRAQLGLTLPSSPKADELPPQWT